MLYQNLASKSKLDIYGKKRLRLVTKKVYSKLINKIYIIKKSYNIFYLILDLDFW